MTQSPRNHPSFKGIQKWTLCGSSSWSSFLSSRPLSPRMSIPVRCATAATTPVRSSPVATLVFATSMSSAPVRASSGRRRAISGMWIAPAPSLLSTPTRAPTSRSGLCVWGSCVRSRMNERLEVQLARSNWIYCAFESRLYESTVMIICATGWRGLGACSHGMKRQLVRWLFGGRKYFQAFQNNLLRAPILFCLIYD